MARCYGHVYVALIAFGANEPDHHGLHEAESYPGPALVIAYSHCIAHGYDLKCGIDQQKLAVNSGVWPLYRYDPRRIAKGEPPLHLDYGPPKARVADYMRNESRFRVVERASPDRFRAFLRQAARAPTQQRYSLYQPAGRHHDRGTGSRRRRGRNPRRPKMRRTDVDLSTTYLGFQLPHPLDGGRLAARRTISTACGVSKMRAPRRSFFARCSKNRSRASRWPTSSHLEHARRVVRRGCQLLSEPAVVCARADVVPRAPQTCEGRGRCSGARIAEWRDAWRMESSTAQLMEEAGADALELNLPADR